MSDRQRLLFDQELEGLVDPDIPLRFIEQFIGVLASSPKAERQFRALDWDDQSFVINDILRLMMHEASPYKPKGGAEPDWRRVLEMSVGPVGSLSAGTREVRSKPWK